MRKEIIDLYEKYGFTTKTLMSQNMFYKNIIDDYIKEGREYEVKEIPNRTGIAYDLNGGNRKFWYYNTISNKNYIQKELFDKLEYKEDHVPEYVDGMVKLIGHTVSKSNAQLITADKYKLNDTIFTNIKNFYEAFKNRKHEDIVKEVSKLYVIYEDDGVKYIKYIYYNRNRFKSEDLIAFEEWLNDSYPY